MKILVLLFLCSCVFGVPLGKEEEALAELLQRVLDANPEENDIVIEEPIKKDVSTSEKDVIANATEVPPEKVDTTFKTIEESDPEKPGTIIGEIILDPIPEEDTTEIPTVTEIIEELDTKSEFDADANPLTGTLIIDTITNDDDANSDLEIPTKTDNLPNSPADEPNGDASSYNGLDTPVRISLNNDNLRKNWVNPFPNRFRVLMPPNRDYDSRLKMLENPFISPLDTLPMDKAFFESTTNADYDVPSQDYPMYDDVYDDETTLKHMNNDSDSEINNDEPLPEENDVIQVPNDDNVPNEQMNIEDSTDLPIEETTDADLSLAPNADLSLAPNADVISNSETENTISSNQDETQDNVKEDYDYANEQMQNYPLDNNPNFERKFFQYHVEREPELIRYNTRDSFRPHSYDFYDKYMNIDDTKHFNPYIFYPKHHGGYDLFFRPPYDVENREKMTPLAPSDVMEPPRRADIKYDENDNLNFDEMLPQDNIGKNMDEANTDIDNDNNNVDNMNTETIDEPKDNTFTEQDVSQAFYNEDFDNSHEWNSPHSVLNSDFPPMAEALPVQRRNSMIENPRYFDNRFPNYGHKFVNNNRDISMYLFNRLIRNLGDNSRFKQSHEYRNNPYNRNDGPIIIFVGPPPQNQDDETALDANQVTSESENQFINSEGTLITDVKHNVDIPYSPGYHPAFYTNYHLYRNNDNTITDEYPYSETQSFSSVDIPQNNNPYNEIIGSYPYQQDDFGYHGKYFKKDLYRNRDYRYTNDFDNLYKPDRYYYRREPRNFLDDNLYY